MALLNIYKRGIFILTLLAAHFCIGQSNFTEFNVNVSDSLDTPIGYFSISILSKDSTVIAQKTASYKGVAEMLLVNYKGDSVIIKIETNTYETLYTNLLVIEKGETYTYQITKIKKPKVTNPVTTGKTQTINPATTNSTTCDTVQCSGTTQSGNRCKNRTTNCNGRCHLH